MVDLLLDSAQVETERLVLNPQPMDLCELVQDVAARLAELARAAGCELDLSDCHPVQGCWDRLRLEQVVHNLLTNAIKYGGGKVDVRTYQTGEAAHRRARPRPRDRAGGPGAHLRTLRARASAGSEEGAGLGLYIVREIVRAHGGRVRWRARGTGRDFHRQPAHDNAGRKGKLASQRKDARRQRHGDSRRPPDQPARIESGIPRLDFILKGGLFQGGTYALYGPPGRRQDHPRQPALLQPHRDGRRALRLPDGAGGIARARCSATCAPGLLQAQGRRPAAQVHRRLPDAEVRRPRGPAGTWCATPCCRRSRAILLVIDGLESIEQAAGQRAAGQGVPAPAAGLHRADRHHHAAVRRRTAGRQRGATRTPWSTA